ncbi:hypothetical protein INT45_012701 [Circinella minor]|uniref:Uncharacterized protein n=1 Tax=Circinella minor TaxID=1195481 RepID=A0A8H7RPE1_9FUNG|nr:hypothetical protein INT45_012701 [Circinella minor]
MSMATSSCTFIPTSPPQERQLDGESSDDENNNNDEDDEDDNENVNDDDNNGDHLPDGIIELQNGDGFIKRRKSPKVICFCGYRLAQAPLDYYQELVMLYLPWRDEEIDVLLVDCETTFRRNQEAILANHREFTTFDDATLMKALEMSKEINPLDKYELDEMQNEQYVDVMGEAGAYEHVPYQEMIVHPERLDNDEYEALIVW